MGAAGHVALMVFGVLGWFNAQVVYANYTSLAYGHWKE